MEKPITFDAHSREEVDDGWGSEASEASEAVNNLIS